MSACRSLRRSDGSLDGPAIYMCTEKNALTIKTNSQSPYQSWLPEKIDTLRENLSVKEAQGWLQIPGGHVREGGGQGVAAANDGLRLE
jgi:hypothetical protein